MKNYLKYISHFFLNTFAFLKSKFKSMIFNLLDAIQELSGTWYYFDIDITSPDNKDHFKVPLFACMRSPEDALDLKRQITRELVTHFAVDVSFQPISKERKDEIIKDLELKFTSNDKYYLKIVIHKAVKKKVTDMHSQLYSSEDLNIGNLDIDREYSIEQKLPFRIKVVKNQGTPLSQIQDFFVIQIDKSKLDSDFAIPNPERPQGGDTEKMKDLNYKLNKKEKSK